MKKEAYEVEYYEPKSVLAMQADRREEKHRRKQKKGIRAGRILLGVAILLFWEVSARLGWIDDYYWSSPSLIAQTAIVQWKEKNLAYDIYFILWGLPDGRCLEKSWFRQCFRGCLEASGSIFHWRLRVQSSANLSHRGTDFAEWSFMRELFWIPR